MNYVHLVGKINAPIDESTRYLEVSRPEDSLDASTLHIPCKYWTMNSQCLLMSLKLGAFVALRGRIDFDNKIGLYVLVEQITIISNN